MAKPDDLPSAAYVGQLRAYLATHGVPPATANALVTMAKTCRQIGNDIAAYLKTLPKAQGKK